MPFTLCCTRHLHHGSLFFCACSSTDEVMLDKLKEIDAIPAPHELGNVQKCSLMKHVLLAIQSLQNYLCSLTAHLL